MPRNPQLSLLEHTRASRLRADARSEGHDPMPESASSRPPLHPACAAFAPLAEADLNALAADIKANGLIEPITMLAGMILDGRCRWDACRNAGVPVRIVHYDGSDPVGFVISRNLRRRHLDESQRAMVAARLATLADGQRQVGKFADVPTQAQAAERLKVSERSVRDARAVLDHASADLVARVDKGEVAVSKAAKIVRLPKRAREEPEPKPLTGEIVSTPVVIVETVLVRRSGETLCNPHAEGYAEQRAAAHKMIASLRSIREQIDDYDSGVFLAHLLGGGSRSFGSNDQREQTEVLEAIGFVARVLQRDLKRRGGLACIAPEMRTDDEDEQTN
jgi:ParB-like chromosome segregation protein Spo0J